MVAPAAASSPARPDLSRAADRNRRANPANTEPAACRHRGRALRLPVASGAEGAGRRMLDAANYLKDQCCGASGEAGAPSLGCSSGEATCGSGSRAGTTGSGSLAATAGCGDGSLATTAGCTTFGSG
jgi:hypothetical protein